MNNIITSQSLQSTLTAVANVEETTAAVNAAWAAQQAASVPYELAKQVSKRSKLRAALLAATEPAYAAAAAEYKTAFAAFEDAKQALRLVEVDAAYAVALHEFKGASAPDSSEVVVLEAIVGAVKSANAANRYTSHAIVKALGQVITLVVDVERHTGFIHNIEVGFSAVHGSTDARFVDPVRVCPNWERSNYSLSTTCTTYASNLAPQVAASYVVAADAVAALNAIGGYVAAAFERVNNLTAEGLKG